MSGVPLQVSSRGLVWGCDTSCHGSLAIDGVDLHTMAWCVPDLSALWGTPDVRGSDRLLPGSAGVIAYPRRRTVTRYSLPLLVNGHWDEDGIEHGDPEAQLARNWAYLQDNLLDQPGTADGTRTAVWTLPDANVVVADVHVLGTAAPTIVAGTVLRTTLELSVPGGDLHI